MTKIYGHRGSKGEYPENTLLSFQKALNDEVEGLELDVHMTRDGEIVVIHDETLDRTTDGSGYIKDLELGYIKTVSAGSKFDHFENYHSSWDNEKVPTLEEVLQLITGKNIELNIELKTSIITYSGLEEKLLSIVNRWNSDAKIVYSSFHLPSLVRLKNTDPSVNIAWLLHAPISNPKDYIETFELEALHVEKDLILSSLYNPFHTVSEYVRVWTVNEEDEMKKLIDLGVNSIITDYPQRAVNVRIK